MRTLEDIDRDTEQLLASRSAMIGGAVTPRRTWADPGPLNDPKLESKRLATESPAAGELAYRELPDEAVNEADEVEARFRRFQSVPREGMVALDLDDVFHQGQRGAREYLDREEDFILAGIRLLIERHQWDPIVGAEVSAAFSGGQDDGDVSSVLRVMNEVSVTQRLPRGGQVAARWVWEAVEDLRSRTTGQYEQASTLALDASIPLLRGAGSVAEESLIQAERDLIYAARNFEDFRREFLVSLASDYFRLVQQEQSIRNLVRSLENRRELYRREQALYQAGRVPQFNVNLTRNDVESARADLANTRESYLLALDAFKIRLGIAVETPVRLIASELLIPGPDVSMEQAIASALAFRLDLQNERDRLDDSRRGVKIARDRLLPDMNLTGGVALRTDDDADEGGVVYELDDAQYNAGVTFGLPLDREAERLGLRAAVIGLRQSERNLERFRDNVVLDVRRQVREIERARFNLLLAEERVRINERRQLEQEIKRDELQPQELVDTQDQLIDARNARDQAVTDLRLSVLNYLLATGQMRVSREGQFEPLAGMMGVGVKPVEVEWDIWERWDEMGLAPAGDAEMEEGVEEGPVEGAEEGE